jgi:lipopolysaccharide export system protein LptA
MNLQHLCHFPRAVLLAALMLTGGQALAEQADRYQRVLIDADSTEGEGNAASGKVKKLIGDVHVTQGTLLLLADVVTVYERADGSRTMVGEGKPVKFRQKLDGSPDWVNAHAKRIEYDTQTGEVRLIGEAWLDKASDKMSGNVVIYNTNSEKYEADGGKHPIANASKLEGGRVHAEYLPEAEPPKTPAAANCGSKP